MGPFGVNSEEGRGYTHGFPETDNEEASKAVRRRYMEDDGGVRRTRGSDNAVGEEQHRETAGNRGAVGGSTYLF